MKEKYQNVINRIEEYEEIKKIMEDQKEIEESLERELIEDIDFLIQERSTKYSMPSLDELNQRYRGLLVRAQAHFEIQQNQAALKDSWKILRVMHDHRKVSHLLTLLRE